MEVFEEAVKTSSKIRFIEHGITDQQWEKYFQELLQEDREEFRRKVLVNKEKYASSEMLVEKEAVKKARVETSSRYGAVYVKLGKYDRM